MLVDGGGPPTAEALLDLRPWEHIPAACVPTHRMRLIWTPVAQTCLLGRKLAGRTP
jgi:hypothetical protein